MQINCTQYPIHVPGDTGILLQEEQNAFAVQPDAPDEQGDCHEDQNTFSNRTTGIKEVMRSNGYPSSQKVM